PPLPLPPPPPAPGAQPEDNERHRASTRGVQATDQNADRAAVSRYRCNVVLGAPSINRLTSLPDSARSKRRRQRLAEFQHIKRRHRPSDRRGDGPASKFPSYNSKNRDQKRQDRE